MILPDPAALPKDDLVEIVRNIQHFIYLDWETGRVRDREVEGPELVDYIILQLHGADLTPEDPRQEWTPRKR